MASFFSRKLTLGVGYFNIYFIWGATFVAISYGLQSFPPFLLTGFRFLVAGILLLTFQAIKGNLQWNKSYWAKNSIIGLLILTLGTGLLVWAEQYVSATEAAVAIGAGPFWFIILDKKQWKTNFRNPFLLLGTFAGFSGLLLFLHHSLEMDTIVPIEKKILGYLTLIASSVTWVIGSLYSRKNQPPQSFLVNSGSQLTIAGLGAIILATFQGEWSQFSVQNITTVALSGLVFLILFRSILAYISYTWLLTQQTSSRVSTHTLINPIVAAILSFILFNTKLNTFQVLSFVIILLSVILINIDWSPKRYRYWRIKWSKNYIVIKRITSPFNTYINNIW